jgi:hypothetical protein
MQPYPSGKTNPPLPPYIQYLVSTFLIAVRPDGMPERRTEADLPTLILLPFSREKEPLLIDPANVQWAKGRNLVWCSVLFL